MHMVWKGQLFNTQWDSFWTLLVALKAEAPGRALTRAVWIWLSPELGQRGQCLGECRLNNSCGATGLPHSLSIFLKWKPHLCLFQKGAASCSNNVNNKPQSEWNELREVNSSHLSESNCSKWHFNYLMFTVSFLASIKKDFLLTFTFIFCNTFHVSSWFIFKMCWWVGFALDSQSLQMKSIPIASYCHHHISQ